MVDLKNCEFIMGDRNTCCSPCHNTDQLKFQWEDSEVCCGVFNALMDREEADERVN